MTRGAASNTTSEADFERLYQVNVKGACDCLFAAVPLMKAQGGAILNLATIAAHLGLPDRFGFSALPRRGV